MLFLSRGWKWGLWTHPSRNKSGRHSSGCKERGWRTRELCPWRRQRLSLKKQAREQGQRQEEG